MSDTIKIALITGTFTILGSFLGLVVSLIITMINKRNELKLARIEIFDGNKFDAYIELYQFLRMVRSTYDPEEEFTSQFIGHLTAESYKSTIKKIGYYSKKIRKHLMDLDNQQILIKNKNIYTDKNSIINQDKYMRICDKIYDEVEKSFDNWDK